MAADDLNQFGRWLRRRREALDLTREELAEAVDCSPSTVRKLEAGLRRPSKQVVELLAPALGIGSEDYPAFMRFAREGQNWHTAPEPPPLRLADKRLPGAAVEDGRAEKPGVGSRESGAEEVAGGASLKSASGGRQRAEETSLTGNSPARRSSSPPTNLPYYPTSFIGRQKVLEQVVGLLWRVDVRLLTLTGPPGVGKTRLAIQTAAQLLEDFADGVFFVPLATLSNPALVVQALAHSFGLRESKGSSLLDTLIEHLGRKQLLLVVDNFEQVVEGAAVLSDILRAAPRLKVLVTSRVPLELAEEQELAVPTLALPPQDGDETPESAGQVEAVQLFVRRSQAVHPEFRLTAENARTVAEITRKLEGLPLAIELAAVRSRYYDPETMLALLQHRLGVLTGGPRDLPARHKTLRSAIAWSYDLLDPAEQAFFRRLGVFSGGFTPAAAQAVAGDGLRATGDVMLSTQHSTLSTESSELGTLESLADKSLLMRIGDRAGERFYMLETVREYALEQLEVCAEEETRGRHADYFLSLAEQADGHRRGPEHGMWLDRQEAEHDNLRAALDWLLMEGDAAQIEKALRMVVALRDFWEARGHFSQGREWLARARETGRRLGMEAGSPEQKQLMARAYNAGGVLAWYQANNQEAERLIDHAIALLEEAGDRSRLAAPMGNLAILASERGDFIASRRLSMIVLAIFRETGDKSFAALTLNNLGVAYFDPGEVEAARPYFEECLALYRGLGEKWGMSLVLDNLGLVELHERKYPAARAYLYEALALCRDLDHKQSLGHCLTNVGILEEEEGHFAAAAEVFREALELSSQAGFGHVIAKSLEGVAALCERLRQPLDAARLWGCAEVLRETNAPPLAVPARQRYIRHVEAARAQTSAADFDAAWSAGRQMKPGEAVDEALRVLPGVVTGTISQHRAL